MTLVDRQVQNRPGARPVSVHVAEWQYLMERALAAQRRGKALGRWLFLSTIHGAKCRGRTQIVREARIVGMVRCWSGSGDCFARPVAQPVKGGHTQDLSGESVDPPRQRRVELPRLVAAETGTARLFSQDTGWV